MSGLHCKVNPRLRLSHGNPCRARHSTPGPPNSGQLDRSADPGLHLPRVIILFPARRRSDMHTQFVDRILTCSDCHGEFIFTAGEQLFFYDKQFTNDPKRCKPCKSRRSGLSAAANGTGPAAAGISRTETRTECSDCGVPDHRGPSNRHRVAPFSAGSASSQDPLFGHADCRRRFCPSRPTDPLRLTLASQDGEGSSLSPGGALRAATSMAVASSTSSVASAADLASIAGQQPLRTQESRPDRGPDDRRGSDRSLSGRPDRR